MKRLLSILLIFLVFKFSSPAVSLHSNCSEWESVDFWSSVSRDTIEDCIASGFDVTSKNQSGTTPLHMAAGFAWLDGVVDVLLKAGAEIDARTDTGMTPLHVAASSSSNPSAILALIKSGADVRAVDSFGNTSFDLVEKNQALRNSIAYFALKDALLKWWLLLYRNISFDRFFADVHLAYILMIALLWHISNNVCLNQL